MSRSQELRVSTDSNLTASPFDPAVLDLAVEELGEALAALDAHERQARQASRATIREKARTGRLKPMREIATGPVVDVKEIEAKIAAYDFDALEDLAAAAIQAAHTPQNAAPSEKEPA